MKYFLTGTDEKNRAVDINHAGRGSAGVTRKGV